MSESGIWQELDRQSADQGGLVVLTGAAGWAGRTLLHELVTHTSIHQRGALVAFGRRGSVIEVDGSTIDIHPLSELEDLSSPVTLFAPLAFLTRDRVSEFGRAAYLEENLALISQSLRVIGRLRPSRVVSISSGAANLDATGCIPSVEDEPYGFLKNVEEWGLTHTCAAAGSGLAVGRLWGATGPFMPIAPQYALSDFILQAETGGPVHVRSTNPVYRRYVDMGQFLEVLVGLAGSGKTTLLDSGGDRTEIGDLACLVASRLGVEVTRADDTHAGRDDYCPDPTAFESAARHLGVELLPLPSQVDRTITGHQYELTGEGKAHEPH